MSYEIHRDEGHETLEAQHRLGSSVLHALEQGETDAKNRLAAFVSDLNKNGVGTPMALLVASAVFRRDKPVMELISSMLEPDKQPREFESVIYKN